MIIKRLLSVIVILLLIHSCNTNSHSDHSYHIEDPLPLVTQVEPQPLLAQVNRLLLTLDFIGSPLSEETADQLYEILKKTDAADKVKAIQEILDPLCLINIHINPEARVTSKQGLARPQLLEKEWRTFLVKIHNEAGLTSRLNVANSYVPVSDEQADPLFRDTRFNVAMNTHQSPLLSNLSGLELEYSLIQVYCRDAGKREVTLSFDAGQGTQDLGFRSDLPVLFTILPTYPLVFEVKDEHGKPVMARFTIKDSLNHVYPSQTMRIAPDFWFQSQVYRTDSGSVRLPAGNYKVTYTRGPEYLEKTKIISIEDKAEKVSFQLERWIDPSEYGYWSGDHHIHASGCAHYTEPTEGVLPSDMVNHILGEDLKVGSVLTWGPGFDYQKQFFRGNTDTVSQYPYLLRYDIEVSGFGSHRTGHLVLLKLKNQIYPGGNSKDHWPTLGLNILKWAKKQGAICGPAHSAVGLEVDNEELPVYVTPKYKGMKVDNDEGLPNYIIPPYNGIGANEYIIDVTHQLPGPDGKLVPAVDFMSAGDTDPVAELNMWYHILNCGFRTRISGETDFPCISGKRVGLWRTYVKLDGKLNYDAWCEGIQKGRGYVSDGNSHLLDFKVNHVIAGEQNSELLLEAPSKVNISVDVAALLNESSDEILDNYNIWYPLVKKRQGHTWNIENARMGDSQQVLVEVIVNGYPVDAQSISADGKIRTLDFEAGIERSSWVAVRIFPSAHTNPVFIKINNQNIRASRRSANWCLKGVDACWEQKKGFYKEDELQDAKEAYDHARKLYREIMTESEVD